MLKPNLVSHEPKYDSREPGFAVNIYHTFLNIYVFIYVSTSQ